MNPPSVPIELERLDIGDGNESQGAKLCDFSFYRMFYSSAKWLIEQCGLSLYDVIFTMEARADKIISERIRERLMEGLTQQLRLGLSRGDALARYTDNQIIGMVQASGYEQACLICERQVGRFYQEHPNVPVRLSYGVWRVGGEKR